jgi:glycosyltransferase involved in cell wall biosynthesis
MKIMLNITCFNADKPTGIEWFALHIAREICKIDSSAMVVSSGQIVDIANTIISRLLAFAKSVFNKYEYLIRVVWDQTWLRYIVAKYKPDILFFPIQDGLLCPPVKQIVTVHDLHYLHFDKSVPECRHEINPLRTKLYQLRMPHILKRSVAVIAVSESTKQDIVASFGINPDKIHVIYNGFDDLRFRIIENPQPTLDRYGLQSGKYFLFVGSILRHKNISRLVQAFARLDSEAILVIAGACKDVDCIDDVRKVAADLGISEAQLRYLDYVVDDDLPCLYNGAISYLLPSLHEGFGVPIIEAMACGIPVITSNCSAMPEVAGGAALLIDPYSVESIAAAMREILDNPRRAESLRKAGLERAGMFRWSYSAQKLYDVFRMVNES